MCTTGFLYKAVTIDDTKVKDNIGIVYFLHIGNIKLINKHWFAFCFMNAKKYSMNDNQRYEDHNPNKHVPQPDPLISNAEKDPDEWTTGDEAMTGAQKSYLKTLSDEAKEDFNEDLTKAEASKRIEELQQKTGRGLKN